MFSQAILKWRDDFPRLLNSTLHTVKKNNKENVAVIVLVIVASEPDLPFRIAQSA